LIKRLVIVSALAVVAAGTVCAPALAVPPDPPYEFNEPSVRQTGAEAYVFDWSDTASARPRCAIDDIPDVAAHAYRDAAGNIVLTSSHFTTRRFVGASFNTLTHPCNVVMASGGSMDPAAFDDHEWINSPYTVDGTNVFALVGEEYQGWRAGYGNNCTGDWTQLQKCWRNSITLATSTNGGATFSSPGALVASSPYRFASGIGPYGYFEPSNIVRHTDGFYYTLIRSLGTEQTPAHPDGTCVMRTDNLADPSSWRAWGGSGFDISFIDPYAQSDDPADHVCQPVDPDLYTMSSSLVYSEYLGKYLLVDLLNGQGRYAPPAKRVPGIYYSTSENLVSWSAPKLLMEAEIAETHQCGDPNPVRVPSLIDHASAKRSFESIGQRSYLYFTRANMYAGNGGTCYLGLDRDLVRIPIEFLRPSAPTLTATDPPSPANSNAPKVKGNAPAGSTVRLFTTPTCSGSPAATGSAAAFASPGLTVSVTDDSTTTFYATATDQAGETSSCSTSSIAYVESSPGPAAPILTSTDPASPANDNAPKLRGSAPAGTTLRIFAGAGCGPNPVATGSAAAFASPGLTVSVTDDSTTTFYATATDQAGETSSCSTSSITYVEDSTVEVPPVSGSPPPPTAGTASALAGPIMPDTLAPLMTLTAKAVKMSSRRVVRLPLTCPATEPGGCLGSVRLETRGRKMRLGKSSFQIAGGTTARVAVNLSKQAGRLVRKRRRVQVRAVVQARDKLGNGRTAYARLILKA